MRAFLVTLTLALAIDLAFCQTCCSEEDKQEVNAFWNYLWGARNSGARLAVADTIYTEYVRINPSAKARSGEAGSIPFSVRAMLSLAHTDHLINTLMDHDVFMDQANHYGDAWKKEGVTVQDETLFGQAMTTVLADVASCFNPDSWNRCYGEISESIQRRL